MKVTIGGEVFDFDPARKPLSEALALEKALKIPYAQYEQGLRGGSALSIAGFIWLVWHRNGKNVPLADILSGAVDIDLGDLETDASGDDSDSEAGPTTPTPPASSTTAAATSARSRKSSTSARGSSDS